MFFNTLDSDDICKSGLSQCFAYPRWAWSILTWLIVTLLCLFKHLLYAQNKTFLKIMLLPLNYWVTGVVTFPSERKSVKAGSQTQNLWLALPMLYYLSYLGDNPVDITHSDNLQVMKSNLFLKQQNELQEKNSNKW